MFRILLFCLLGQVLPAFLLYAERKKQMKAALVYKALASLYFVILGLVLMRRCPDPRYARFIAAGLILGCAGDVLLNVCHLVNEDLRVFLAGGTLFLAGHVMYLFALGMSLENRLRAFLFALAVLLPLLFYVYKGSTADSRMRILTVFYLVTVTLVFTFAAGFFLEAPGLYRARLVLPGTLFFLLSDTLLIKNMMNGGRLSWTGIPLILMYYLGQTLIALSLG